MEKEGEKVYVAIGTEGYDGFSTLKWALTKWGNHGIKIAILHAAANGVCRDYVYTPLGKLPTSSVSEEKLQFLDKSEEAKRERVLAQYIAFCGRVETAVVKMEAKEQPLHQQMVEAISALGISKLVVSMAFMKAKSRSAMSGTFYVVRHKPDWCELFLICEGQRIFLREENEEGFVRRKDRNLTGRMIPETSATGNSPDQWEKCSQEIQQYADELVSLHQVEGDVELRENSTQLCLQENMIQNTIQLNTKQATAAKERHKKAERAIRVCNAKAEELQTCLNMDRVKKAELNKMLDTTKDEIIQLRSELVEKRSKLNSIVELQKELSRKLDQSSSSRARAELQLEKGVRARADMVAEIEELRKQRDVLQRRIEFCKEKDAIVQVSRMDGFGSDFREFSPAEIKAATEDFSQRFRLKSACHSTNVYRARINHITVAVRMYDPADEIALEAFKNKVKLLSQVQHPNTLAMIGFCSQLSCIVYEYMHNGNLHDALFSTRRSWKQNHQPLNWHSRISIAAEICSALGFLHKNKPNPIIHGNLRPSKILLDRFNVAKIHGLKISPSHDEPDITLDIRAFGNLVLQLLTGKNGNTTEDSAAATIKNLDCTAGEWPVGLATELSEIAASCLSVKGTAEEYTTTLVREMNDVKKRADQLVDKGELPDEEAAGAEDLCNVPGAFICPIYQEVMQSPHLAADGFSYELDAIEEWLITGHETSPMTNLGLKHKLLIPNHTLRSLIEDWRNKTSNPG